MDRAEFWLEGGLVARAARDGNPDRVLDTARPRREHDDAVREPQGLVEIVRDVKDRERAGNADALAHAAGELLRERLGEFREPGALQGVGDERAPLGSGELAMLERQRDVVGSAAPGQQGEILENERDRIEALRREIAEERDLAARRLDEPAH